MRCLSRLRSESVGDAIRATATVAESLGDSAALSSVGRLWRDLSMKLRGDILTGIYSRELSHS